MKHTLKSFATALGLVIGVLLLAEVGFTLRDRGAFSDPNFYVLDADLGVRLVPGSQQRLAWLGVHPAHTVHINSKGYRGSEFPGQGDNEIAVIGDSLTFGLGVENHETFSAQLQALLGEEATVINYGVPSYGPHEQNLVVKEVLASRPPKTLIYTLSAGRFLGKTLQPYSGRIIVDDGWMLKDLDPLQLPLPKWLNHGSHLVDAIRQASLPISVTEFAAEVIKQRQKDLLAGSAQATAERQRLKDSQWLELLGPDGEPRAWSILLPELRELKQAVDAEGSIRIVLVVIPQDVQIDPSAWTKYEMEVEAPVPTREILEDLAATANALDMSFVDGTTALQAVTPGAFLTRDWHLSPSGHEAIAQALYTALTPKKKQP